MSCQYCLVWNIIPYPQLTGHKRIDGLPTQVDLGRTAAVSEDILVAQLNKGELAIIAVSAKVLLKVSNREIPF